MRIGPGIAWIVGFVIPLAIGIPLALDAAVRARQRKLKHLIILPLILTGIGLIVSVIAAFTVLGGLGPGTPLLLSSALSALVSFLLTVTFGTVTLRRTRDTPGFHKSLLAMYLVGGFLIPLSQLVPLAGTFAIWNRCNSWHQGRAEIIIAASENFKKDQGVYPREIEELMPMYLEELPIAQCLAPHHLIGLVQADSFSLHRCGDTTFLLVPSVNGISGPRYNFDTTIWSSYDTWDNPCEWLE